MRTLILVSLVLACKHKDADSAHTGPGPDSFVPESGQDSDSGPIETLSWVGERSGAGMGSALAAGPDGRVYSSAPWAGPGEVFLLEQDHATPWMVEDEPGALGASLAADEDGVLAGAPLRGAGLGAVSRPEGELSLDAEGAMTGSALHAAEGHVLVGAVGRIWLDGVAQTLPVGAETMSPRALAWWREGWLAGTPQGEQALVWAEGALARPSSQDEAGYSLCVADLDEDGDTDLAMGAPGANRVYLFLGPGDPDLETAVVIEGSGRFGHALSCLDGALAIGAPMAGDTLRGEVWTLGPNLALAGPSLSGDVDWEQLGGAVLLTEEHLYAGGCGDADCMGLVLRRARP